jgi:hypothetical protein
MYGAKWVEALVLQVPWHHLSEAVCLGQRVYFFSGQRKIRGRRLPGLVEE